MLARCAARGGSASGLIVRQISRLERRSLLLLAIALAAAARPALAAEEHGAEQPQPVDPALLLTTGSRPEPAKALIPAPPAPPIATRQPINLKVEANDEFAQIAPGCGLTASPEQSERAVATCPFTDLSTGLSISTTLGGFETHARFERGFTNPWTSQNLLTGTRGASGWHNTTALFGVSGKMLDGRVSVRSDQAWSTSWEAPWYAQPIPLQRRNRLNGRASWYGLDAALIRSGRVGWSISLDYSNVGDRYFIGQNRMLGTALALPGERLTLSSKLQLGETRLSLSNDRYRSTFGTATASRIGFSRNGVAVSLAARGFDTGLIAAYGPYASRSHALTGSLDVSVDEAASGLLVRLGQSPLFPRSLSLSWRDGWIENSLPASNDRYLRKSWSLSASWESRFGETDIYYSQDRRIGVAAPLGSRADSSFQVAHMVRWSGWRAGLDATVTRSNSTSGTGYRSTSYSGGATLAYQLKNGPEFKLQVGRDLDRMALNDRSYLSANDGTRLTASLDLTAWLNHSFARKDLRLRFEFRQLLEAGREDLLDPEQQLFDRLYDRRNRDVVQISFGMAL